MSCMPAWSVPFLRRARRGLAALGLTAPMVGRDSELSQMRSAYDQAVRGHAQVVRVFGEAGCGKTRLVEEFLSRLDCEVALGSCEPVFRDVRRPEAASKGGQALAGEAQHGRERLLDVAGAAGDAGAHLDRLVAEEAARRVDAVDADVVERPAAEIPAQADVARHDLHGESGGKDARLADAPGTRDLDRLLMEETGLPVIVADDPLTCVVRGSGKALEKMEHFGPIFTND